MKIKTLFFSFTLVLCFVVSGFMFSACGGVSHTYDEVKTSYASMVANNQDFFDKDGYISITYIFEYFNFIKLFFLSKKIHCILTRNT